MKEDSTGRLARRAAHTQLKRRKRQASLCRRCCTRAVIALKSHCLSQPDNSEDITDSEKGILWLAGLDHNGASGESACETAAGNKAALLPQGKQDSVPPPKY